MALRNKRHCPENSTSSLSSSSSSSPSSSSSSSQSSRPPSAQGLNSHDIKLLQRKEYEQSSIPKLFEKEIIQHIMEHFKVQAKIRKNKKKIKQTEDLLQEQKSIKLNVPTLTLPQEVGDEFEAKMNKLAENYALEVTKIALEGRKKAVDILETKLKTQEVELLNTAYNIIQESNLTQDVSMINHWLSIIQSEAHWQKMDKTLQNARKRIEDSKKEQELQQKLQDQKAQDLAENSAPITADFIKEKVRENVTRLKKDINQLRKDLSKNSSALPKTQSRAQQRNKGKQSPGITKNTKKKPRQKQKQKQKPKPKQNQKPRQQEKQRTKQRLKEKQKLKQKHKRR